MADTGQWPFKGLRVIDLSTEIAQLLLAQSPFQEGARVDAGRGVPLDVDEIAAALVPPARARSD